jgi:hypothetical protein
VLRDVFAVAVVALGGGTSTGALSWLIVTEPGGGGGFDCGVPPALPPGECPW